MSKSSETYTYAITDFPNNKVNLYKLSEEIRSSDITHALEYINATPTMCDIIFKEKLNDIDTTSTLPAVVAAHDGEPLEEEEIPKTPDGVPIVRADSRPLDSEMYFTMCGDSTGIGDGTAFVWDFSNSDNDFENELWIPPGFKAKHLAVTFNCPVWLKDGTMYFFDAPWGQHISMFVGIPAGSYYPNKAGTIPGSMLGQTDGKMYAYTTEDIPYQSYVMKHRMYGSCPMGDELNAEGAAMSPIPPGWRVCALIVTPEDDVTSKGFASLEMYRCHTMLLPGETLEMLHS